MFCNRRPPHTIGRGRARQDSPDRVSPCLASGGPAGSAAECTSAFLTAESLSLCSYQPFSFQSHALVPPKPASEPCNAAHPRRRRKVRPRPRGARRSLLALTVPSSAILAGCMKILVPANSPRTRCPLSPPFTLYRSRECRRFADGEIPTLRADLEPARSPTQARPSRRWPPYCCAFAQKIGLDPRLVCA